MTIANIINITPSLNKLSEFATLPAKLRWNLSRNLKTCNEVAKDFDEQRIAIVKRHAGDKESLEPGTDEHAAAVKEIEELMAVESEVKLLRFAASDIVKDDVPVPAALIAAIDQLIEGEL